MELSLKIIIDSFFADKTEWVEMKLDPFTKCFLAKEISLLLILGHPKP